MELISLNDWYIIPFQLKNHDEYGQKVQGNESSDMRSGNTGEISYLSQGIVSRGMADIEVTLPEKLCAGYEILTEKFVSGMSG